MVDVILGFHEGVHIFLIVELLVHSLAIDLFDVKSSPFSVAVVAPLVCFAGGSYFYVLLIYLYLDGSEC